MADRRRRREWQAARLDRLTAVLSSTDTEPGETVGDVLDRVSDPDARHLFARCLVLLTAPEVSEVDRAHAAAWLHRGLWSHPRRDPSVADLLTLVSPVLPWPSPGEREGVE